ncbi:hypothetical protein NUSPORA_01113 [Nucleospora cyclopteri]
MSLILSCSIAIALCIIIVTLFLHKTKPEVSVTNPELINYFQNYNVDMKTKKINLLKAAKYIITFNEKYFRDHLDIAEKLYNKNIIGDSYMDKMRAIEEDLLVDKILIEKEAEVMGINKVFQEANCLPYNINLNLEKNKEEKEMEERNFILRQEKLKSKNN